MVLIGKHFASMLPVWRKFDEFICGVFPFDDNCHELLLFFTVTLALLLSVYTVFIVSVVVEL